MNTLLFLVFSIYTLPASCFLSLFPQNSCIQRWCTTINGLSSRRLSTSISDQVDLVDSRSTKQNFDVFLRFSPLIGGPNLLPLHVEVILASNFQNAEAFTEKKEDLTVPFSMVSCDSDSDPFGSGGNENEGRDYLHRIDFLPKHPKDPSTLLKLLTFRPVPGLVRHRILYTGSAGIEDDGGDDDEIEMNFGTRISVVTQNRIDSLLGQKTLQSLETDSAARAATIILPLGSIVTSSNLLDTNRKLGQPRNLANFLEDEKKRELHLITNNCYFFAWNLLKSLQQE